MWSWLLQDGAGILVCCRMIGGVAEVVARDFVRIHLSAIRKGANDQEGFRRPGGDSDDQVGIPTTRWGFRRPGGDSDDQEGIPTTRRGFRRQGGV
ncbi:putative signal peptide protein [Puccinia sorghi]|uniref:Putative signal peptide protein n=1 Tax=Puccinia sorghi TaxID=27349 RepID=A0A0L6V100_9BASI|nr:putative signal peptide protein [Puccinia sorghi]